MYLNQSHTIQPRKSPMRTEISPHSQKPKPRSNNSSSRHSNSKKRTSVNPVKNQNAYSTSNFFNNTMTQMNQGKDTEVNPLVRRRMARIIPTVTNEAHSPSYHFAGFTTPGNYYKRPFGDHYDPRINFTPQFAQENEVSQDMAMNDISFDIYQKLRAKESGNPGLQLNDSSACFPGPKY